MYSVNSDMKMAAGAKAGGGLAEGVTFCNVWRFEARDPQGNIKWVEEIHNIIVNVGLDDILDKYYKGSTYTASFFVGLTDGTPTVAAADTMASHAGWTEVTAYDEAGLEQLRQELAQARRRIAEFEILEQERKHAQDAVRESERKIRAVLDQTFQFIGLMEPDGTLIDAGKNYKVAGWATVGSRAPGPPIWEVVAQYLRSEKVAAISKLNTPVLKGVAGNPGISSYSGTIEP